MRAVVQRVSAARVRVDGAVVGAIDTGLLVLLGVAVGDTRADVDWLVDKVLGLRIFSNDAGKFDRSLIDVGGALLVVSQFTLLADTRRGRRPSFTLAAPPDLADSLYAHFVGVANERGVAVATGVFGSTMDVELTNHGPVTIVLDSREAAAV